MMIPPTIDLPPGFQERTPITSTAFDQAYQSSIAFGTANLPQNRSRFAASPDSDRRPFRCLDYNKIPDDRITQELHDQKQCNSRPNHYGKVGSLDLESKRCASIGERIELCRINTGKGCIIHRRETLPPRKRAGLAGYSVAFLPDFLSRTFSRNRPLSLSSISIPMRSHSSAIAPENSFAGIGLFPLASHASA